MRQELEELAIRQRVAMRYRRRWLYLGALVTTVLVVSGVGIEGAGLAVVIGGSIGALIYRRRSPW